MEKIRLQLAKPIAWFMWLSMCPGTHESEFMLMMAFVLLQPQSVVTKYFVMEIISSYGRHKARIVNNSYLQNRQSFSYMIFVSLKKF